MKDKTIIIGLIIMFCLGCVLLYDYMPKVSHKHTTQNIVMKPNNVQPTNASNSLMDLANAISLGIINGLNNFNKDKFEFENNKLDQIIAKGIKNGLNGCSIQTIGNILYINC